MRAFWLVFLLFCGVCHANDSDGSQAAIVAAGADGITSVLGLAHGGLEASPLGLVGAVIGKGVVLAAAAGLPDGQRADLVAGVGAVSAAASLSNLVFLAGGPIGASVLAAVLGAVAYWNGTERERVAATACQHHRTVVHLTWDVPCLVVVP